MTTFVEVGALNFPVDMPEKLTPEGERLRDQMVEEMAAAVLRFYARKGLRLSED